MLIEEGFVGRLSIMGFSTAEMDQLGAKAGSARSK